MGDPAQNSPIKDTVTNFISASPSPSPSTHTTPIAPVNPSDIIRTISKLNNKKVPGVDSITNLMLKNIPINIVFYFTKIINAIFKLYHFPNKWKTAGVCAIPKSGYLSLYLPISGSSVFCRALKHLQAYLDEHDIIIPEQFGFTAKHTSSPRRYNTHQLLRVVEFVSEGFQQKEATGALFYLFGCHAKAFDKVWLDDLIYKLIQ